MGLSMYQPYLTDQVDVDGLYLLRTKQSKALTISVLSLEQTSSTYLVPTRYYVSEMREIMKTSILQEKPTFFADKDETVKQT